MNNSPKQPPADRNRSRLIIIVLILIFSAPLLSSWFILNYTDMVRRSGANHGDLYDPLITMPKVELQDPFADNNGSSSLNGKWSLLYISNGACGEDCQYMIYSMRQVRMALSRYARHLQRVWMTDIDDLARIKSILSEYQGTLVLLKQADAWPLPLDAFAMSPITEPLQHDCLYVIDPHGQLVLRYRPGADPDGIISDLKRLLKSSEIN
mgnify:CR=1 FL=1